MPKTITLRLSEENYERFLRFAEADNRPISNAIETLALRQLEELFFVDPYEMEKILADDGLVKRLRAGHEQAVRQKGRFID